MRCWFLALVGTLAIAPGASARTVWRVPKDKPTIQQAVDEALTDDVILISPGTYAENVVVSGRHYLTLRGKGNARIVPSSGVGLDVDLCSFVTIEGLRVETEAADGIRVTDSKGVSILDSRVTTVGTLRTCIRLEGCISIHAARNVLRGAPYSGFTIFDTDDSVVAENDIDGPYAAGIRLHGERNALLDNVVRDAPIGLDDDSAANVVAGNVVLAAPFLAAIWVDNTEANMVVGNTIVKPVEYGIFADDGGGLVQGNVIKKPGTDGIRVEVAANPQILGNVIRKPGGEGIWVTTGSTGTIGQNVVKGAGLNGFRINGKDMHITGNSATGSAGFDLVEGVAATGNVYAGNVFPTVGP